MASAMQVQHSNQLSYVALFETALGRLNLDRVVNNDVLNNLVASYSRELL